MRSYTDVMWIQNNAPSDIGPAQLGVRWIDEGPPVRAEIIVMPHWDEESPHYEVTLGETFPVGDETWRFADVDMKNADEWRVIVRRVDENEVMTPPSGHVWKSARLRPYGQLDEAQLLAVEAELGTQLPPNYRRWLGQNNGAQPEVEHHVPGLPFALIPERPLLGVHPQYPPLDLVHAQRVHRDPWLSPDLLVIANLSGGLLVLTLRERDMEREGVYFLPETGLGGPIGPAGATGRERHLVPIARSIGYFLGKLTPIELPDLPPPQPIWPGEPGHSQHEDQPRWSPRPARPSTAMTTSQTAQTLVLPVGQFFGTFHPVAGSTERYHRVRLGDEVWELDDQRFTLWALAHGAGDRPADQPWTVAAVRDAAASQLPGVDSASLLHELLTKGLAVEVAPDAAVEFARRHRVGARMLGLGNSAEQPWLWSIGFFEHPVVRVTRTVYDLWEHCPSGESLWVICQALADEEREAGGTEPDLADPEQLLAAFLRTVHRLLTAGVLYLEPLP